MRSWNCRWPYVRIGLAGFAFWMATLHSLRYPHPALILGWIALSGYLACYLPIFVALARVAVWRLGVPLVIAAPVVWTGTELCRAHLVTGFRLASLGHTQYRWIDLIQIADLAGAYAVGLLLVFVAACVTRSLPIEGKRGAVGWLLPAGMAIAGCLLYGSLRSGVGAGEKSVTIALIQGSIPSEMKSDPSTKATVFREYYDLSLRAAAESPDLDLIVWPETMYRDLLVAHTPDVRPPPGKDYTADDIRAAAANSERQLGQLIEGLPRPIPMLLGADVGSYGSGTQQFFNSAVLVDKQGSVAARYDKMHRVMFGEYIPLADYLPGLYKLTPLTSGGIDAGERPTSFSLGQRAFSANICFETVLPHVIRRQVRDLAARSAEPDFLVNLTNDGWYRGSSLLDLHLICGVFRAVECRKPLVIAANTGISASISSDGRILNRGRRGQRDVLIARPRLDSRRSVYLAWGDWLAGTCLVCCVATALLGLAARWRRGPVG